MIRRISRLCLYLYPLGFRRRYGAEMEGLLDEMHLGVRTVGNLLAGALKAQLRPLTSAEPLDPTDRVRVTAGGVLYCWVIFTVAGLAFYKTTEDAPFAAAGHAHPLLGSAHLAVQVLAALASGAVVLGALPLMLRAFAAARADRHLRRPIAAAIIALTLVMLLTGVVALISNQIHARHPGPLGQALFVTWAIVGVTCAATCVIAVRVVLFRLDFPHVRLLAAFGCATAVTVAMALISLAVAAYAAVLPLDAGGLAGSGNGPIGFPDTGVSLLLVTIVMFASTALAAISVRRGWRAARRLGGADGASSRPTAASP